MYAHHNPKGGTQDPQQSPTELTVKPLPPVKMLSTMSREEVLQHMHHPDTSPPEVRPCDTPNGSDLQTQWSAKQLHCITGCRTFKNYQHLLQCTRDGKWVATGEYPMSLGTYSTIRKAARGKH